MSLTSLLSLIYTVTPLTFLVYVINLFIVTNIYCDATNLCYIVINNYGGAVFVRARVDEILFDDAQTYSFFEVTNSPTIAPLIL